jgi:hypothetical protein
MLLQVLVMTFIQISDNFLGTQMKSGLIYQYSCVDTVKSILVYMKYLYNIIKKEILR